MAMTWTEELKAREELDAELTAYQCELEDRNLSVVERSRLWCARRDELEAALKARLGE